MHGNLWVFFSDVSPDERALINAEVKKLKQELNELDDYISHQTEGERKIFKINGENYTSGLENRRR